MRAALIVLGDLGQSPRMLFHARALAAEGLDVDLIGTSVSALPSFIGDQPRIAVRTISDRAPRVAHSGLRYVIATAIRGARLLLSLTHALCWRLPRPDVIVVQNPPGVPTLAVAWLAARCRRCRLVVDWHNLTSAMLALRLGQRHPLVKMAAQYEALFGRAADANLFVSSLMKETLTRRYNLQGTVFRDRPADTFAPLAPDDRVRVRARVFERLGLPADDGIRVLISPTSWTADERLELLFEALEKYEARARRDPRFPFLAVLITGKGPLEGVFNQRVAASHFKRVRIQTGWLPSHEYAATLAAADLGISCHVSASGLDLPMKILDLFGAGVPVCAYDYGPCLLELVSSGDNGVLFRTAEECCNQLEHALYDSPSSRATLDRLRNGAIASAGTSWSEAWTAEARDALIPGGAGRQV